MKNLKISLTTIVFAIILTISTGVFAAHGVGEVDPDNAVSMPGSLTNGEATVSGATEYQFVEVSEEKYNNILKLEAMYKLEEVYVRYSANALDPDLDAEYRAACEKFENAYGEGSAAEVIVRYGSVAPLDQCKSEWIEELPDYDDSAWVASTNNKISVDLSTFNGSKHFVAWVKANGVYDAEAFKVTGSKVDEQPQENPQEDPQPTPQENKKEPKKIEVAKKDGSSTSTKIPHAGVSDVVLVAMASVASIGGVSYIRYRRIK